MATQPVAFYGSTGSVASGKDTYSDKTLCVQEIVSGECVFLFEVIEEIIPNVV